MASSKPKIKAARAAKPEKKTGSTSTQTTAQRAAKLQGEKTPAAKTPAYMQAKLAVSHPQDGAEQEADHVARQVMRAAKATPVASTKNDGKQIQRASLAPAITPDNSDTLALKPVPAAQNIQRRAAPANAGGEKKLQQKAASTPAKNEQSTTLQRDADSTATESTVAGDTESRIDAQRGNGSPLPDNTLSEMQARFARDFTDVRIHNSSEAAELCAQTNARAFTVGNDIFFAPGEFSPASDAGKELLAHELTHVVQQEQSAEATVARKAKADGGEGTYTTGEGFIEFDAINIPRNLRTEYNNSLPLVRHRAFSDDVRPTAQQGKWRDDVNKSNSTSKLSSVYSTANSGGGAPASYVFKVPSPHQNVNEGPSPRYVFGTLEECARELAIPSWNSQGRKQPVARGSRISSYDVDHIVEAQIGASSATGSDYVIKPELDTSANFQLLAPTKNNEKKEAIKRAIREKVGIFINENDTVYRRKPFKEWNVDALLGRLSVKFLSTNEASALAMSADDRWTKQQIEDGAHIQALIDASPKQIQYTTTEAMGIAPNHLWIFHGPTGGYKNDIDTTAFNSWRATLLSPFEIVGHTVNPPDKPDTLMSLQVNVPANHSKLKPFANPKTVDVKKLNGSTEVGFFEMEKWRQVMELRRPEESSGAPTAPSAGLELKSTSPLTMETLDVIPGTGVVIEGQILPTLPIIGAANIRYRLAGTDLSLSKTFTVSEINLPPPISVDACTLTLSAGTRGVSADGRIDISIERLGQGFLGASIGTEGGLALEGGFDFDSTMFDRAHVEMWYREGEIGAAGDIGIDQPNKIRGIRSASINARYERGALTAHGTINPTIPAVQQGAIDLRHSSEEGLCIAGDLLLAEAPGIRSGRVHVDVQNRDEQWHVAATGTAQPAIPGVDSQLTVNYDDGAFVAEFSGAFSRGMLSGNATVGATNRSVDADGRPTGEPAPDAPLIVYGSGSATVQIAPWLQGTAGICFAPNGEVTVSGEIGLPNSLTIFDRREINRPLFNMATQIPIIPGIVAEVGGNLSAHASIGPGALDQCRIGIEYNPSREEDTHVTGDAHLNIPAEAGLRLAARAGIGLGITGASATGGIELGGTLGIGGAAEAGVHIDWTPRTGLGIDAEGYLHAAPKFRFDVSGYVAVTALGFSVYDNRYELAAYEVGSDMNFGVRFPIHYREGQPFDVSLDDVQFETPDVNAMDLVRQVGDRIFA